MAEQSQLYKNNVDVFISYSRYDSDFGRMLHTEWQKTRNIWIDWEDIPKSAEWWEEICRGIERADNFVLILSQHSLSSPVCHLEIEYAIRVRKRMIIINHAPAEIEKARPAIKARIAKDEYLQSLYKDYEVDKLISANWDMIARLNWISDFQYDNQGTIPSFNQSFVELNALLDVDLGYIRGHTRILQRSIEWYSNHQNWSFLLSGDDITSAETWLAQADELINKSQTHLIQLPLATQEQRAYISASRLHEQKQTAETLLREKRLLQFRITSLIAGLVGVFAIVATIFAGFQLQNVNEQVALAQSTITQLSPQQTQIAYGEQTLTPIPVTLTVAANIVSDAENQAHAMRNVSQANQILATNGNIETAALLAVHAVQIYYSPEADFTIQQVLNKLHTTARIDRPFEQMTINRYSRAGSQYILFEQSEIERTDTNESALMLYNHRASTLTRLAGTDGKFLGNRVVMSTADGIKILDIESLEELYSTSALGLDVTQEGQYLMVHTQEENRLLEGANFSQIATLPAGQTAFSKSGNYFAILTDDDYHLEIYATANQALLFSTEPIRDSVATNSDNINLDMQFTPDEKLFVFAYFGSVHIWNLEQGTQLTSIYARESVDKLNFSPDGRFLFLPSPPLSFNQEFQALGLLRADPMIYLISMWDLYTGENIRNFRGHTGNVNTVVVSPDGQFIVSGSDDKTIRIWDIETTTQLDIYAESAAEVQDIEFLSNQTFVSRHYYYWESSLFSWVDPILRSEVRFWRIDPLGPATQIYSIHDELEQISEARDDYKFSLLGFSGGQLFALTPSYTGWFCATGAQIDHCSSSSSNTSSVYTSGTTYDTHFSSDYQVEAIISGESITIYQYQTSDRRWLEKGQYALLSIPTDLAISPDNQLIAFDTTPSETNEYHPLTVLNIETGEQVQTFDFEGAFLQLSFNHDSSLLSVVFNPVGYDFLICSLSDGTCSQHDSPYPREYTSPIGRAEFLPSNNDLIVQLKDAPNSLYRINLEGQEVQRYVGHGAEITSFTFSPSGTMLLTTSEDGTARVWDLETGRGLRSYEGHRSPVYSGAFAPDETTVITGDALGTIHRWKLGLADDIQSICNQIFRTSLLSIETEYYGLPSLATICPERGALLQEQ